mmetsp:Transcript_52289/g.97893  ORF Transcript_52289/g.97893 Transcript_52289/m.97893 type:complete len:169 (+) Transcript_52289:107-613(+)
MHWVQFFVGAALGLGTLAKGQLTVSGPLIDNLCWLRPNHQSLDNPNLDLSKQPLQHSVHCFAFVSGCVGSGFSILHKPDPSGDWEILHTLDAASTQKVVDFVKPLGDVSTPIGKEFTLVGELTTDNKFSASSVAFADGSEPPSATGSSSAAARQSLFAMALGFAAFLR